MLTTSFFEDHRDYLEVRIDRDAQGLYAARYETAIQGQAALIGHGMFSCGCSSLTCSLNTALEVISVYGALSGCEQREQPPTAFVEGCCS